MDLLEAQEDTMISQHTVTEPTLSEPPQPQNIEKQITDIIRYFLLKVFRKSSNLPPATHDQ